MTSGYPWRQRIIPRTYKCTKTGKGCAYEKCPLYTGYSEYLRAFDTCPYREMIK